MSYRKPIILLTIVTMVFGFLAIAGAQGDGLAPDGETGQIYYAPFPVTITLDGEIDDWEGVPRGFMSGGGHSVTFAAASDGEFVYFLGDVTDENIISGEHGENYWNEDSIEFYINGTGDLSLRSYTDGVTQVTVPALNKDLPSEEAILAGVQGSQAQATVEVVETDKGYRVEMAVPVETDNWNIVPEHGATIGFQVHLNAATEANRDTKLIWSVFDTSDQSYLNPGVFGYLIFYEVGQTDLPQPPEAVNTALAELPPVPESALYRNGNMPTAARIIDIMSRLTLDEKIAQMTLVEKNSILMDDLTLLGIGGVLSGGGGYPADNSPEGWAEMVNAFQDAALESRLGIPIIYGVDAVHGHNNVNGAVIYPHNVGLGATRNADLVEQICQATAQEMIATGIYWDYSPVVAVPQDIRWGRTYETFGEDTALVTELAMACLDGLQGDDIGAPDTVIGTPKHYVGDGGAEWGTSTTGNYEIDQGVMNVDEATIREIHLPPYTAAIENGAESIMISFSSWNDEKMHGQQYLITDVLKGELGFEGFIVSDWAGIDQISDDFYDSVVQGINAGIDMVMVPYNYFLFIDTLKSAVNNGDVPVERIDDAVTRILEAKFDMGLFENPYANPEMLDMVGSDAHREIGRQAVAESQVLLKNEGDVLPLTDEVSTIYVAGQAADNVGILSGGWTIEWQGVASNIFPGTTILEGLNALAPEGTTIEYSEDGTFEGTANVGIVVVGEMPYAEGLGDDPDLSLSEADLATIEAVSGQVDSLVVVIVSGRPLIITDHIDNWDAVVAAWLPGSEAHGVADVLFGYQPFSGKLPLTWPASVDQLPLPVEDPLFEYGYGLETEAIREPVAFDYSTVVVEAAESDGGEQVVDEAITIEETVTIADFELEALPEPTTDENGNGLGIIPWGDTAGNVTLALSSEMSDTTALEIAYDVASFGGFSWVPGTDTWEAQDWTAYDGVTFDLYGANSGGIIQVEIFDNRTTDGDSAERWFYHITDDYEGWQTFVIPFNDFQRRTDWQPEGAPDDGLGLNEVHGMAFGMPVGTGAHVTYLDNLAVFTAAAGGSDTADESDAPETTEAVEVGETTTIADFELEALPEPTTDENGNGLGIIPWGDTPGNVTLALSSEMSDSAALEIAYDVASFGGFSWVPGTDTWEAQDWTAYDGVTFDLYGNNTGGIVQVEIFDNRTTDGDSAERWFYHITDDYEGWQTFVIPFSDFQRRTDWQPEGAPDDGLGLNEVHGMAFGMPIGAGAHVAYLDNLALFTVAEGASAVPSADSDQSAEPDAAASASDDTASNLLEAPAGESVHVIDDFEFESLPEFVQDEFGNNIGLVPWGDTAGNVVIDVTNMDDSTVLSVDYDVASFGGFSHVNNDGQSWTAEDWSDFYGIQFDLYGTNSGGTIQFEVFDNRTNDGDSAERWFYHIVDDFEGWKLIQIPFTELQRRTDWQPGGAPDDGLGLDAVSGYAFGMPIGTGAHTTYIDNVALYGGGDDAEVSFTLRDDSDRDVDRVEVEDYTFNAPWTLVWEDNFDAAAGEPINAENWTCRVGGFGWANNAELQYYRDSTENVVHNGEGYLVITAREEAVEDSACRDGVCEYTSGRCVTEDKQEFTYGKIEARIRVPEGQGIWPAFWMMGGDFAEVNWPNSGEIDILENIGSEPNTVHGTVHGPGYSGGAGRGGGLNLDAPLANDFHVYAIEWEPNVIRWYIDGQQYFSITPEDLPGYDWVFDHEFFLLLNVAVGGHWPGYPDETTEFPQTMEVDYVRVYQRQ